LEAQHEKEITYMDGFMYGSGVFIRTGVQGEPDEARSLTEYRADALFSARASGS
jgi:hypothetical protein